MKGDCFIDNHLVFIYFLIMRITKKNFKVLCEKYGLVYDDACYDEVICTGSLPEDEYNVDEWQPLIDVIKYDNDNYFTADFWCGIAFNFDVSTNEYKINYSNSQQYNDYNELERALSNMMTILNQLHFIHKMFVSEKKKNAIEKDFV